jgi:hypothetical protein
MSREIANFLGILSILLSIALWCVPFRGGNNILANAGPALLVLSFILPLIAGWKGPRGWLLLVLSPIVWFGELLAHVC